MKKVNEIVIAFLLLVMVTLPVFSYAGEADPVAFADVNLKAAVEAQLGITDPTAADMLGLTYLSASFSGVTDLSGLEYAENLTELWLDGNSISDLSPLSGLTALTYLGFWDNNISDLSPLSGLTALTYLDLGDNHISDLSPLSGLTALTYLYLYNNSISDLSPLSGLTALTYLYLYNNSISDLSPLSGLTALTRLYLDANSISDLSPLSGLTALTELYLGGNSISDLSPLSGLTALTYFGLWNNSISDLSPLSGLTALTYLSLGVNSISDLSPLSGLTALTRLGLWDNSISDLSPLSGLTALIDLSLSNNSISDLSPLSGLTALTYLSLYDNSISDLSPLSGLTALTYLSLYNNSISDLSPLSGLTALTELYLEDNPLNGDAYQTWIPVILSNNPGIDLRYDQYSGQVVVVISPNGGEILAAGRPVEVKWSSQNINAVDLEYSMDNGTTWHWFATVPCVSGDNTCWWQPQISGDEYLIRASDSNNITCTDSSDAVFSVYACMLAEPECDINHDCKVDIYDFALLAENWLADGIVGSMQYEDFESGDFHGYNWLLSGDANWSVVSDTAYQGSFAAKSGLISHDQKSVLEITVDTGSLDTISFYRKVSSESNYDYLRFYIDDVEIDQWSGELDWALQEYTFTFTPGQHTFKWSYTKDGSVSNGFDCAWIDNIIIE